MLLFFTNKEASPGVSPWLEKGQSQRPQVPPCWQLRWPGEGKPCWGPRAARVYICTHGDSTGHRGCCGGILQSEAALCPSGVVCKGDGETVPRRDSSSERQASMADLPVSPAALEERGLWRKGSRSRRERCREKGRWAGMLDLGAHVSNRPSLTEGQPRPGALKGLSQGCRAAEHPAGL